MIRLLLNHPDVELTAVTSRSQLDVACSSLFPSLRGLTDLKFTAFDSESIAKNSDLVFTALPHGSSMGTVSLLAGKGVRVIDLSADFRFGDLSLYKQWYGEHTAGHLLEMSVYGLPEINRERIRAASIIGNPGCYPTSAILPLVPLVKKKAIDHQSIVINSASGVSGAGRPLSIGNVFCEVNEDFKAYKVGEHRHIPEIEATLSDLADLEIKVTFTPHLAPMNRGILSTITAKLAGNHSTGGVLDILNRFYDKEAFIRILPEGTFPGVLDVRGSNYCDIGVKVDERTGNLVIVSAIDNLVKGASGQALQNMNIMLGFKEDAGLGHVPLSI